MPAEIVHTLFLKGIGNDVTRRVVVNIDTKGVLRCRIGCFNGTLKTGLKRIARKYRKGSPYYKTVESMGKELQRQRKRYNKYWRGNNMPIEHYDNLLRGVY